MAQRKERATAKTNEVVAHADSELAKAQERVARAEEALRLLQEASEKSWSEPSEGAYDDLKQLWRLFQGEDFMNVMKRQTDFPQWIRQQWRAFAAETCFAPETPFTASAGAATG